MNAKHLNKTASGYNHKKFKKQVIALYKDIRKTIKNRAKRGLYDYNGYFSKYSYERELALRFFKIKHQDFKCHYKVIGDEIRFEIEW